MVDGRLRINIFNIFLMFSLRFLLEKDPDLIQTHDNLGRTPLHYAYAIRDTKLIQLLIVNKANEEVIEFNLIKTFILNS